MLLKVPMGLAVIGAFAFNVQLPIGEVNSDIAVVNHYSTDTIAPMEWYFRMQPTQRIELLDSLIKNGGSAIIATLIEDDVQALLGDTTSLISFCTISGVSMTITHTDNKHTDKIISGWKQKLLKNNFDKNSVTPAIATPAYDSIFPDSASTFLFFYVKLPLASRIEYFSKHAMAQRTDFTKAICTDLNSVTGCNFQPFIIYNGRPATDMTELIRCEVCWKDWLIAK